MNYRNLLDKTDSQGVKGLMFFGQSKILVYRRDNKTKYYPGYLDLPGGGTEKGETVFETFARELKEEFGLGVNKEQITYVKIYPSSRFPGHTVYFLVAVLPEKESINIRFGDEGLEPRVMELKEYLRSDKIMPDHKKRISDFLSERSKHA